MLHEAEVQDLHEVVLEGTLTENDVPLFDVSMNESPSMRVGKRVARRPLAGPVGAEVPSIPASHAQTRI
jgi:hypothetical protein